MSILKLSISVFFYYNFSTDTVKIGDNLCSLQQNEDYQSPKVAHKIVLPLKDFIMVTTLEVLMDDSE